MTKRLLALFLVCILAIPIFALPASATTTETVKIDTTQYNGLINNIMAVGEWCKKVYQWAIGFDDELFPILNNNHTELGSWLETIGANMVDGLTYIEEALYDFNALVDGWFDLCYDYLGLIYNSIKTNFETLFGEYLSSIKTAVSSINNKFNQLLNGSEEDQTEAEEFQNQVSTESTEMQEALDQIEQATIPDYEGVDTDFDSILSPFGYTYYSNVLKYIFNGSTLLTTMLTLAFTFALLSYAFFGKR